MGKDSWVWLPASMSIEKNRVQRRKREQGHHRTRESLGLVGQLAYLKETMRLRSVTESASRKYRGE